MSKARKLSQLAIDAQIIGEQEQQQIKTPLQTQAQEASKIVAPEKLASENVSPNQHPAKTRQPQSTGTNASVGRGRGATRGGHLARRNVFERREPAKKRRSFIETASDPSKEPKLFPNWSLRRKAELAGRGKADAAPDLTALGGLFDPSNPSSFKPLRPATLRHLSSTSTLQVFNESNPIEISEPSVVTNSRKTSTTSNESVGRTESFMPSTSNRPTYNYDRHGHNAICYFWHQRGSCSKGFSCGYIHSEDPSLPIVPAPNKSSLKEITVVEDMKTRAMPTEACSPPSRRRSINEICFFWNKNGTCIKGADCSFVHDNSANLPLAPDPIISRRDTSGSNFRGYDHWPEEEDRQAQNERDRRISSDRYESRTEHQFMRHNIPPLAENNSTEVTGIDLSTRPPWNERDPFNSICYFWHNTGTCVKGSECNYIHSHRDDLPVAPHPSDKASKPCKFWAVGDCYLGTRCPYMHSPGMPEAPARVASPLERRKSVSFATEDCGPEPDKVGHAQSKTGPGPPPEEAERFDRTCVFWTRNDCYRGESCWYNHSYDAERPKETEPVLHHSSDQAIKGGEVQNSRKSLGDRDITDGVHTHSPLQIGDGTLTFLSSDFETSDIAVSTTMSAKVGVKATKISMEEYRKKTDKILNHRVKEVVFGNNEPQSVVLDFGEITDGANQPWSQSFSEARSFKFRQICTAQDFEALYGILPRVVYWNGGLATVPADRVAMEKMETFSQHLRLCSGGVISVSEHFTIVIYPSTEEWKMLATSGAFSPEDKVRYLIFQPSVAIKRIVAPKGEPPTLFRKTLVRCLHGLRYRQFLHTMKSEIIHHFYLMFPTHANHTAAFFASWLLASDSRCKVYSSQIEGSWNFFVKSRDIRAGVVLIHESVIHCIADFPWLYSLLTPPVANTMFTFWCISDSNKKYPIFQSLDTASLGQIAVTRIFPHGHAILLTPSFLVAEPEKANVLIDWFRNKLKKSTPGTWKIVCAHDIRTYLLQLALEKSLERDQFYEENHDKPAKDAMASKRGLSYQACEARFICHKAISDLSKDSVKDQLFESYDSDNSSNSASPIIYADMSIDPDNEQLLITWFAGWSIRQLDKFRKYTVVGTNSSSCEKAVRRKDLMKGLTKAAAGTPSGNVTLAESYMNPAAQETLPTILNSSLESNLPSKPKNRISMASSAVQEGRPIFLRDATSSPKPSLEFADGIVEIDASQDQARQLPQVPRIITGIGGRCAGSGISPGGFPSSSRVNISSDNYSPTCKPPPFSSAQCNGPRREKLQSPQSSRSDNSSVSRLSSGVTIRVSSNGPKAVDAEYGSRRGSAQSENKEGSGNRRIEEVFKSASTSRDTSRKGSNASYATQSLDEKMDIDSPQESSRNSSLIAMTLDSATEKEFRYESTTAWYRRLKTEGKAWEHIYVDAADGAFKVIGVK